MVKWCNNAFNYSIFIIKKNNTVQPLINHSPGVHVDNAGNVILCPNEPVTLFSNFTERNQWLLNDFPISDAVESSIIVSKPGVYTVRVTDDDFNVLHSNTVVVLLSNFKLTNITTNKISAFEGDEIKFLATTSEIATSYTWDFGDNTTSNQEQPLHIYTTEGKYSVNLIAESTEGCLDTLTKIAYININKPGNTATVNDLWLPTAFTPNGDGENDVFIPRGEGITDYTLQIFNHWGEKIFLIENSQAGWDGLCMNGLAAPSATYTYLISYNNGEKKEVLTGKITLLR
jgi:gliding motility-associated-like protein